MKKLSHVDSRGAARMVDVSGKKVTLRKAVAEGFVFMAKGTMETLLRGGGPKGEVLGTARIAGVMGAKRCGEMIPLCHPLPVEQVTVDFEPVKGAGKEAWLRVMATATITAKTGVEMEALTAVCVAGLTVIDMLKAVDKEMRIEGVRVLAKSGGKKEFRAAPLGKRR